MKTIAVLGLGNRGGEYSLFIKYFHGKRAKIVSICDLDENKLNRYSKKLKIDKDKVFASSDEFFGKGVLADAIIIATQDSTHYIMAKRAMEVGYKYILLEKPVSGKMEECYELNELAKKNNVVVVVCHVLRYSNYFGKIKKLIENNAVGKVVAINQVENVGYFHFCHSFVRGAWRNEALSSPSILAKCCHDLDLLYWYADSEPISVSSLGGLIHFKSDNAPEGSTDFCMNGCMVKDSCPYDAEAFYITDPFWKAKFIKYLTSTVFGKAKVKKEEKREILRNGQYGRCVYRCDNDVCDYQTVSVEHKNGIFTSLTMTAFSAECIRETRVLGTFGEIVARDNGIKLLVYGKKAKTIKSGAFALPGHVEGDIRTVKSFIKLINNDLENQKDVTTLDATLRSHKMAALAEISRKNGGEKQNF